jgi:DNA-binding transcriptional regulator GbsR (MarR family)
MEYQEAKSNFIQKWGELGSKWGINKTMAQLHALLLVSPVPLCMDQLMTELSVSRGNACMNLKALTDWGLIYKKCMTGCRKEYYIAEKDIFKVFRQIVINRKKEELEPLLQVLDICSLMDDSSPEAAEFGKVINELKYFSNKADAALNALLHAPPTWVSNQFLKMIH